MSAFVFSFNSLLEERPPALPLKQRNISMELDLPDSCGYPARSVVMRSMRHAGRSPTSSTGSNPVSLTSSIEDKLNNADGYSYSSTGCRRQNSCLSNYDNMLEPSGDSVDRSSVGTRQSVEDDMDSFSPPLPEKKTMPCIESRRSTHSLDNGLELYDNLSSHMAAASLSCNTMMHRQVNSEFQAAHCTVQYSSRSTSNIQSNIVTSTTVQAAKAVHVEISDSGYLSTSSQLQCAVIDGAQCLAPPLPPKLKHS